MGEAPLQPITEAHVGMDQYGNVAYVVNGRTVSREDFNAVSLTRIAFALDQLVNVTAAAGGLDEEEDSAPPSEDNIFGVPK